MSNCIGVVACRRERGQLREAGKKWTEVQGPLEQDQYEESSGLVGELKRQFKAGTLPGKIPSCTVLTKTIAKP